jgi:hypothetical protein
MPDFFAQFSAADGSLPACWSSIEATKVNMLGGANRKLLGARERKLTKLLGESREMGYFWPTLEFGIKGPGSTQTR